MQDVPGDATAVLRPGETCWRVAQADRFGLIVDAADYFAAAREAMMRAERTIFLIGWDFDLRIELVPGGTGDGMPTQLGPFLKELTRRNPKLRIFILKWDMSVVMTVREQMLPLFILDLKAAERIRLRFDSAHPWMAAHHQKIAVIDDSLAFCGGIDMTTDRWDTRGHIPGDERRRRPDGSLSQAWHDAATVVDGEAARALGEVARERWLYATGKRLPPPAPTGPAPWPEGAAVRFRDVPVGLSRTMPAYEGRPAIREIEALYLTAIRSAKRWIYLESQYFASAQICDAVLERLAEADCPEIVVVNPLTAEGWLDQETMGVARDLQLDRLRRADPYGRFSIWHPVDAAGEEIYVHAKVLIVDDRLIRVGSSNVNNRSMGFDTECDLTVEARDEAERETVLSIRDDLLAEHLEVPRARLREALEQAGSLRGAIEALRKPEGRSLRPIPVREVNDAEIALKRSRLADPERPKRPEKRLAHFVKRLFLRRPVLSTVVVALTAAAVLGLALLLF